MRSFDTDGNIFYEWKRRHGRASFESCEELNEVREIAIIPYSTFKGSRYLILSAACVAFWPSSLVLGILLSFCRFGLNTGVRTDLLFGLAEMVSVRADELSGVVRGTVSDNDLGGVLVGHHNGGAGESVTVGVRVVGLKLLSVHTGVRDLSGLVGIAITVRKHKSLLNNSMEPCHHQKLIYLLGNGNSLGGLVSGYVNRLLSSLVEGQADSLTISEKDSTARGHTGVFEVSVRFAELFAMDLSGLVQVGVNFLFSLFRASGDRGLGKLFLGLHLLIYL